MVRAIKQECFWDVFLWTNNFRRFTKPEKNDDVGPRVVNKAEKLKLCHHMPAEQNVLH